MVVDTTLNIVFALGQDLGWRLEFRPKLNNKWLQVPIIMSFVLIYLLTSSSDWAMKNPTVLAGILEPVGLMEMLVSSPSSCFSSTASRSNFNFTKQSLDKREFLELQLLWTSVLTTGWEWQTLNKWLIAAYCIVWGGRLWWLTLLPGRRWCQWRRGRESLCTSHNQYPAGNHSARLPCQDSAISYFTTTTTTTFCYHLETPHSKQVSHHSTESWGHTRLGNESQLELCQADNIITLLPVPARNVQQVGLQYNIFCHHLSADWPKGQSKGLQLGQSILADQSLCYKRGSGEVWIRDFVTYVRLVHFQGWTRSEHNFCKTSSEKPFQGFCPSRADKGRRLEPENDRLKRRGKHQPLAVTSFIWMRW